VVIALRVEPARHVEHLLRQVDERHGERRLEVDGVVPTAAAQLEDVGYRHRRRTEDGGSKRGLLLVLLGRRDQRARSP